MQRKDHIDAFGALSLIAFAAFLAFNQVVVKVVNEGIQPVFFAGIRSAGSALVVWAWVRFRGRNVEIPRDKLCPGLLLGALFAVEFLCLFLALDLTTVARASIIFYSMPVWLSAGAHVLLPGERLVPRRVAGLVIAFGGVAWVLAHRGTAGHQASLTGDLCALGGALSWAALALLVRGSGLRTLRPEVQHFWQLTFSAPVLLLASPLFGPFIRDLQPIHLWALAFQIVLVAAAGFLFWLWLLSVYPASGVASFSFLSPIFGVVLGWLLLGEKVTASTLAAGALVALGILLINWPARRA